MNTEEKWNQCSQSTQGHVASHCKYLTCDKNCSYNDWNYTCYPYLSGSYSGCHDKESLDYWIEQKI